MTTDGELIPASSAWHLLSVNKCEQCGCWNPAWGILRSVRIVAEASLTIIYHSLLRREFDRNSFQSTVSTGDERMMKAHLEHVAPVRGKILRNRPLIPARFHAKNSPSRQWGARIYIFLPNPTPLESLKQGDVPSGSAMTIITFPSDFG